MKPDDRVGCSQCRKWAAMLLITERDTPAPHLHCSGCGTQELETYHAVNLEMIERKRGHL